DQVRVRHIDLDLDVRFDRRILEGSATLYYDRISSDELILDTRDLTIHSVDFAAGFQLGHADPVLGAPLRIRLAYGAYPRRRPSSPPPGRLAPGRPPPRRKPPASGIRSCTPNRRLSTRAVGSRSRTPRECA